MLSLSDLIIKLNSPIGDIDLAEILCLVDENAGRLIATVEDLYQLLSCIHSIIDSSCRRGADNCEVLISDIAKSHALTTYTSLVIQFGELGKAVRGQYTKALVEMIFRRSITRRDYVNSYLRSVACECLKELELSFPGEVTEVLKLADWLGSTNVSSAPQVVEAVHEEQMFCFESYSRLLLCCCMQFEGSMAEKALLKVVSLTLDSIELSSSWFRGSAARMLPGLIRKGSSEDNNLWTHAVVNHHFSRLLDSVHAHQVHAFLCVARPFVNEWDPSFSKCVVDRIYAIVLDEGRTKPLPVRQMAVYWLCELVDNYYLHYLILDRQKALFFPSLLRDPWQLVEVKLQAVLRFAVASKSIPRNILACLSGRELDRVAFRFMVRLLKLTAGGGEEEEKTLLNVPEVLIEALKATSCAVQPLVVSTVRLIECVSDQNVQKNLLYRLGVFITSVQPPSKTIFFFPILAFMASSQANFDSSAVVVCAAKRFLDEPLSNEWNNGLKIIELARLVLIHHGRKPCVEKEVLSLLNNIVESTRGRLVDIVDRANTLIRYILRLSHDERLPFLGMQASPKKKSETEQSSISLKRDMGNLFEKIAVVFQRNLNPRKRLGINDGNWGTFIQNSEIVLPFTFHASSFGEQINLFAIELSFSLCDGYERIAPVEIPFLKSAGEKKVAGFMNFPFKYDVLIKVKPTSPVPALFHVDMSFTDQNGNSHTEQLTSFKVSFEDLFAPVPAPKSDWPLLFRKLWKNPFAKLLPVSRSAVNQLILNRLGPFLLPPHESLDLEEEVESFDFDHENLLFGSSSSCSDSKNSQETKAAIIFIPPGHHLLLRFFMGEHTCAVWIATDRVEILSLLDSFFNRWLVSSTDHI